jgi:hypothetical protein
MEDFKTRLIFEHQELRDRRDGLLGFLTSEAFARLQPEMQDLMRIQAMHMGNYLGVLFRRMELLGIAPK